VRQEHYNTGAERLVATSVLGNSEAQLASGEERDNKGANVIWEEQS
jgi:hypothetical protein